MSKVTVVTDANGDIIVIGHGHLSFETAQRAGMRYPRGGVRPGPGQKLHELELAEDVSRIDNWLELHGKVRPHLR
jgi:hypothetical protein